MATQPRITRSSHTAILAVTAVCLSFAASAHALPEGGAARPEDKAGNIEGTANPESFPVADPDKALLSTIRFPAEMKAAVFARQPDVQMPTAITFDEQNRLYIAETHRFARGIEDNRHNQHWLRDDIALTSTADRLEMYRKYANVKPMDYYTRYSEKIQVLEDRDGDGKCDHSQVFAEGFNDPLDGTAAGIMAANGKVYFACIPNVWQLRDTDGDGKADERISLQEGFGISVSLSGHDLNGFVFGPDGRIYFTIGDRAYNLKTADGRHLYDQYAGAIFRMEPDGSGLEVVHRGLRNPKEIAFDQYGSAFSVDNNADMGDLARVVYMVEGADSGWNRGNQNFRNFRNAIDVSKRHDIPWMKESGWQIEGQNRPAAYLPPTGFVSVGPSGLAYNPGTSLAEKWDNHFFVCDFRGGDSEVIAFEMEPAGAGYSVASKESFIKGFLNTDVEFGYDGKVYVSDYTGSWTTYGKGAIYVFQNPEEIAKPVTAQVRSIFAKGFAGRPAKELADLLGHPDMRVRLRAQFELAGDNGNRQLLLDTTASDNPLVTRLHGVWGLGQLARRHKDTAAAADLATLTRDPEWRVRGQAVQALGDASPAAHREVFAARLNDENLNTRMLAAIALGKAGNAADIPALIDVLENNADADTYLRHGAVQALQSITEATASVDPLKKYVRHPSAAVRRGLVLVLRRLKHQGVAAFLTDKDPAIVIETIQAINDAYIEGARPALAKATDWLGKSTPMIDYRIINAIFRVGGDENARRLLSLASDGKLSTDVRMECLFALRRWENPPPADPTTGKVRPVEGNRDLTKLRLEITSTLNDLLVTSKGELLAEVISTTEAFGIQVAPVTMITHFTNPANATSIRLAALDILLHQKAPQLAGVLRKTVEDRDPEVRAKSFAALASLDPDAAMIQALKVLASNHDYDRQQVFAVLASMKYPAAAEIVLDCLRNLETQAPTIQLDILEAAAKRSEPDIVKALAAYQASLDPSDPVAPYQVALEGGDVARGRSVFYNHGAAECSRCHKGQRGRDAGGDAGPDLWNVGSLHDRAYILESVINPAAQIAQGYGIGTITLTDGTTIAGKLAKEDDEQVSITDLTSGKIKSYQRSEIRESSKPMSTMPPMGGILSKTEVRDVVAYLASLQDKNQK